MYTRYCFSRSNFLVELVAGLGGALLCGVPGVIVGSFYGSVYPEIMWGGLKGEPAAGMLGLLVASAVGGWMMVYVIGQLIHDHRSGLVSFFGTVLGMVVAVFLFDYSFQPWFTVFVLVLPVVGAAFGYNLPVPRGELAAVITTKIASIPESIPVVMPARRTRRVSVPKKVKKM